MHAIRGAIQVDENTREAISEGVRELCAAIVQQNRLDLDDVISAIFTLTVDLDADFPARAAREVGWGEVPLLCAQELPIPGALPRVCRVLLHVRGRKKARHVYLRGAAALRPDLAKGAEVERASATKQRARARSKVSASKPRPAKKVAKRRAPR